MRKVTVSRMRERYAQTVLTSRITYVDDSVLLHNIAFCSCVAASRRVVWYTRCFVWPVTRQALYVQRHIEARSWNHCYSREAISYTYSECVFVALVIQNATRMCRIMLSSVACPAAHFFPTLPYKRHDFRWKRILIIQYMFWFSLQFLSENSRYEKNRARYY